MRYIDEVGVFSFVKTLQQKNVHTDNLTTVWLLATKKRLKELHLVLDVTIANLKSYATNSCPILPLQINPVLGTLKKNKPLYLLLLESVLMPELKIQYSSDTYCILT